MNRLQYLGVATELDDVIGLGLEGEFCVPGLVVVSLVIEGGYFDEDGDSVEVAVGVADGGLVDVGAGPNGPST